ncbi:YidC/Oxa1 family membrane protein insertase [Nonomuraea dietziae]|jgi:YidC/Oxa1 family membrane protein insertase|uniref:Membrane protein insertase YidC n=1 Tax=Nonomuraea dietziae TaxID=65515 RepID=A0A7W5V2X3_9ACTN|nr:membrane protein insertase YidC [Nonomuraea dietziae]MBB3729511.1 YidC/Oxa1 family membrane protein insertase [Nonomuraea dietziae]
MIDSFVMFITGFGGNTALVIVLFTLAVRLLLLPLSIKQARAARIRMRLAPRMQELQKRHSRDPERLSKEMSALYAKEGTSPFAGFGPALAQMPFLWLMYQVATHPLIGTDLLGQHLAVVVAKYGLISWPVLAFAGVIVAIALIAWYTSRRMEAGQFKILKLLPYGTVIAAAVLPLAAGIYLLVSTAWTAGERRVLYPASLSAAT